jgi:hypothetical protein
MSSKRIVLAVTFFLPWLSIFLCAFNLGWSETWRWLQVSPLEPIFADMRTIQAGLYAETIGLDAQINNPSDPWQRVMNYPAAWISIADVLNLQVESHFLTFVLVQIVLFLTSLWLLVTTSPSIVWLPLLSSWSLLLCLERGNNDMLMFSLTFFALRFQNIMSIVFMTAATLLKLYPILALPAFIRNSKNVKLMIFGCAFAILVTANEITNIRSGTPVTTSSSYGSQSLAMWLRESLGLNAPLILISGSLLFLAFIISLFGIGNSSILRESSDENIENLFIAGGCVYIGTFLLSGNFDYRLIFLLFCVPFILTCGNSSLKILIIFLTLVAMNYSPLVSILGVWGSVANLFAKIWLLLLLTAILIGRIFRKLSRNI